MKNKFTIAESGKMLARNEKATFFYDSILDPEEIPYLVTDEACLYSIFVGDEKELIDKVWGVYKVKIDKEHFRIPFWKLLDFLDKNQE